MSCGSWRFTCFTQDEFNPGRFRFTKPTLHVNSSASTSFLVHWAWFICSTHCDAASKAPVSQKVNGEFVMKTSNVTATFFSLNLYVIAASVQHFVQLFVWIMNLLLFQCLHYLNTQSGFFCSPDALDHGRICLVSNCWDFSYCDKRFQINWRIYRMCHASYFNISNAFCGSRPTISPIIISTTGEVYQWSSELDVTLS